MSATGSLRPQTACRSGRVQDSLGFGLCEPPTGFRRRIPRGTWEKDFTRVTTYYANRLTIEKLNLMRMTNQF
jgi:hypothetical protein